MPHGQARIPVKSLSMTSFSPQRNNFDHYPLNRIEQDWVSRYYEFMSEGRGRQILKGVGFQRIIETPNYFHCLLGDVHADIKLDTKVVTNNGDTDKVMMTVAVASNRLLAEHPECQVALMGEDRIRIRLYRSFISKNIEHLSEILKIDGATGNLESPTTTDFAASGQYDFFLLSWNDGLRVV